MSCIRDDVRMIDLVIPGSHDSATWSMRGFAGPFAQTQHVDVLAQLHSGIRYLDLRVTWSRGRPVIVHNFITGLATDGLLREQVAPFVREHLSEVVILDFQELAPRCRRPVVEQLRAHLDADRWALPRARFSPALTLGDVRGGGHRLLVIFGEMSETEFRQAERDGWLPAWALRRDDVLHSPYDARLYASGPARIPAFLTGHCDAWAKTRDRLFVAQAVYRQSYPATFVETLRTLAKGVRGRTWSRLPHTPAWLDLHHGHHLDEWIAALTPESPVNILMRDFVDRHAATIASALRLNLQHGHAIPGDPARRLDDIANALEQEQRSHAETRRQREARAE
ncbi:MAG: hypothetical protein ACJ8GN_07020 [Longimicrobiaceae bacterium]